MRPFVRPSTAGNGVRVRLAAARRIRPRSSGRRRVDPRPGHPRPHHVAVSRTASGGGREPDRHPGRGMDAVAACLPIGRSGGRSRPVGEGRGAAADRNVQGPRGRVRDHGGGRARRHGGGPPIRWQRRWRVGGVRRRRRHGGPRGRAVRHAGADAPGVRGLWGVRRVGRRLDLRRRPSRRGGIPTERLAQRGDPSRAVPHRGEEDTRARDRRTARLAVPRRDRLPGRRRRRAHRDLASGDPTAFPGLGPRRPAAPRDRAGHGMRAAGEGVPRGI